MPVIKRIKKGMFPSLYGKRAYELVEVDIQGNPIRVIDDGAGSKKEVPSGNLFDQIFPARANKRRALEEAAMVEALRNNQVIRNGVVSKTEKKIGPGMRAPDIEKGYSKPFNYHLYNKIRKKRG